ncbi:TRAP transporter small permease [Mesorhizobium australicum]|uniref:TRAP transporter small permease protein n=1 Tax=Mesorhizobium australicum TaxID=536018 RepID=A0A1X7PW20_9HYPH|nr:TRAP transporter small permease [Mesorhizobium australicum]SMH56462.1 TRAP-type C4-dicarboxylate transport system, small permease component [Mesorhizobium australicum]
MNAYVAIAIRILNWIAGLLAFAALALPTYQIFAQVLYPPGMRPWIYEVFIYLLVWASLLTASTLAAEGKHIRVDSIFATLKGRPLRYVETLNVLISLTFCGAIAYYGYKITYDAWDIGERSVTSLQFPMWIYYAALPASFLIMSVFYAIRLAYLAAGRDVPGLEPEHAAPASGSESV